MTSRSFRRLASRLFLAAHRNQPWMSLLQRCQEDVASADPNPYYPDAYRDAETGYWFHILRWMTNLSREGFQVKHLLDIGCAYGTLALFSQRVFHCDVYCTDFTNRHLSPTFRNRYGLRFAVNNIERDAFPWTIRFDLLVFTEVIEHLNFHPVPTIRKIRDLLAPRGKMFLSTPRARTWRRHRKYCARLDDIPMPDNSRPLVDDHVWEYTRSELLEVVREGGFTVDRFAYSWGQDGRHFNMQLSRDESR